MIKSLLYLKDIKITEIINFIPDEQEELPKS
jgi:hypothetical protein